MNIVKFSRTPAVAASVVYFSIQCFWTRAQAEWCWCNKSSFKVRPRTQPFMSETVFALIFFVVIICLSYLNSISFSNLVYVEIRYSIFPIVTFAGFVISFVQWEINVIDLTNNIDIIGPLNTFWLFVIQHSKQWYVLPRLGRNLFLSSLWNRLQILLRTLS